MRLATTNNNQITKLLTKHSDANIYNIFHKASINLMQLSPEYHSDQKKLNLLLNDLTQRHIIFRNALIDPIANHFEIENHFKYLFNPNTNENGQLRGLQAHLSSQMFRDFGQAGNNINNSILSADYLSNLIITKLPYTIEIPFQLVVSSPSSFQEALEAVGAKMYSSITPGFDKIYVTADNPSVIKNKLTYSSFIDNKPSYNTRGDYLRESVYLGHITLSESDNKSHNIGLVFNPRIITEPRIINVGTVDPFITKQYNIDIATRAINGSVAYKVKHLDPNRNNSVDIKNALKKAQQTGKTEDLIELAGIPIIVSNDNNQ